MQFICSQVCVSLQVKDALLWPGGWVISVPSSCTMFCVYTGYLISCDQDQIQGRTGDHEERRRKYNNHTDFSPQDGKSFSIKISRSSPSLLYPKSLTPGTMVNCFYPSESLKGLCECHSSPNILTWITPLHPHYRDPVVRARGQIRVEPGYEF